MSAAVYVHEQATILYSAIHFCISLDSLECKLSIDVCFMSVLYIPIRIDFTWGYLSKLGLLDHCWQQKI